MCEFTESDQMSIKSKTTSCDTIGHHPRTAALRKILNHDIDYYRDGPRLAQIFGTKVSEQPVDQRTYIIESLHRFTYSV